ncbi:MAG TPA: hypothetical protein VJH03_04210 [Blastocatellia bacterium]|nr:hypothetical protein [Blastocatellia bacterium]
MHRRVFRIKLRSDFVYAYGRVQMRFLRFLNHTHYWGIPHPRSTDNRLVQTCYECGAEREVKMDLRPSPIDDITLPLGDDDLAA